MHNAVGMRMGEGRSELLRDAQRGIGQTLVELWPVREITTGRIRHHEVESFVRLEGSVVEDLDESAAKRVGVLLSKSRRRPDVVDAAGVVGAGLRGDAIVTSDPDDINRLVAENGVHLPVVSV